MALSPQYGWAEPDNSSLVKNGAADIRTLGDAIDTSVWNVGFGQAGKNKIINGNMAINQRNFTSATATSTYTFDRWITGMSGSSVTYTPQTFTAGTAPVAGYEATNFLRIVTASQSSAGDFASIIQRIEDVRTFAGNAITVSFWAKAASGTPLIGIGGYQSFGSGGSTAVVWTAPATQTISTSWARYSFNVSMPSVSGKTIGAGSFLQLYIFVSAGSNLVASGYPNVGLQNNTFDIWGVQAEYGSKATPFQTASGGSPQQELAMCQRYYWRFTPTGTTRIGCGYNDSTTFANVNVVFPVPMRIAPTALEQSGTATDYSVANNVITVCSGVPSFSSGNLQSCNVGLQVALGLVAGQAVQARLVGTAGFLGWSAEL